MTIAIFQATWGKAYKFFPLKPTFLLSIFLFELGSLICAIAPSSAVFILGRAIAGVGAAGITSRGCTIISLRAEPKQRAVLVGMLGMVRVESASVIGPILGGVFSDYLTWRWCLISPSLAGLSTYLSYSISIHNLVSNRSTLRLRTRFSRWTLSVLYSCWVVSSAYFCCSVRWRQVFLRFEHCHRSDRGVAIVIVLDFLKIFLGKRAMVSSRIMNNSTVMFSSLFAFYFFGSDFKPIYYLSIALES